MQVGLIGLGKMGAGMAVRLVQADHEVVGFDVVDAARTEAIRSGVKGADSVEALVDSLSGPRLVWLMLPPGGPTDESILALTGLLTPGDLVVDGGNSDFRDAPSRASVLAKHGIEFADVGVSGGQWGWKNGYGLMVGSSPEAFTRMEPALQALSASGGYHRVGALGAGHLVKAIHNGVQYAILQAYGEGFALVDAHDEVDTLAALSAWQQGSSIRSWLLEQTLEALRENPTLEGVVPQVADSGMGRWTAEEAIRLAVPTPVLTTALHARFSSRDGGAANKLLVAARGHIGGQKS